MYIEKSVTQINFYSNNNKKMLNFYSIRIQFYSREVTPKKKKNSNVIKLNLLDAMNNEIKDFQDLGFI